MGQEGRAAAAPTAISVSHGLGPAVKSSGESSGLGNRRLTGTVHLSNCRESEEVIPSESECVCEGEGRILETL